MNRKILILTRRIFEQIFNKKTGEKLAILIKAPIFVVLITIIAKDNVFVNFEDTNTLLFILSCSAFFIGMSNTLQEICKERPIVKRELQSRSYRPFEYVMSKMALLSALALLQSVLLIVPLSFTLNMPSEGVIFPSYVFEMIITTFISILSAGSLALVVSASSKNTEQTMGIMPILILIQIIFSGVIIKIEDSVTKIASYFTISKWTMEAYGTSSNINTLHLKTQNTVHYLSHEPALSYLYENAHLLKIWGMMLLMTVLFVLLCSISVNEIVNDGR